MKRVRDMPDPAAKGIRPVFNTFGKNTNIRQNKIKRRNREMANRKMAKLPSAF